MGATMDTSTQNMMPLQPMEPMREPRDWPATIDVILVAATVVVVTLTVVGILLLVAVSFSDVYDLRVLITLHNFQSKLGWLLAGIVACVLCGAAVLLIHLQRSLLNQSRSMDQRLATMAEQAFNQANAGNAKHEADPQLAEVRCLLADIREIMLLPDAQRQARFRSMMQAEFQQRLAITQQFIVAREFHRARAELASLADRFGTTEEIRKTQEQLSNAMFSALGEDIETATRKVSDLMTMGRWEHAEQYARELTEKYPDAPDPRKLLERVQEERAVFDRRHRQRMHDEIQQFVNQRRWREAAGATELFIQTFPTGVDSDVLRQQLDTLKANAEIEIRQQLERHIKEYVTGKDYWAALELARRIIAEYPFSPQANVLRMQLPKLEDLARQQGPRS
jgi:tetratricopeptide (TPR) repeat protein